MAEETERVVRRFFEVRNQGDVPAMVSELHPDVEFDMSRSRSPYSGIYRGKGEVADLFEEVKEAWENIEWEVAEVVAVDKSTVVVPTRLRGRGRGSGIELGGEGAGIYTVADGKIRRFVLCQDRAEALELAGLARAE